MNEITLSGEIISIEYSHNSLSEKFYDIKLDSIRQSGISDTICCIVSEVYAKHLQVGQHVKFTGNIRTRNIADGEKSHLSVFVFVNSVEEHDGVDENCVILDGFICKEPSIRDTPLGRKIADALIAVNLKFGKSAYIPCVIWGRNAERITMCKIGTELILKGRLQSRNYTKQFEDGSICNKTAYEVSVSCFEEVNVNEN